MTLLVGAALFATAIVLYVIHPILTGRSAPEAEEDEALADADARRRAALRSLRDLEYDRAMGKLDDQDYTGLREELARQALEALEPRGLEEARAGTSRVPEGADRDLEEEIVRIRASLRAGGFCPACGHGNEPGSRYCARCGGPLAAGASGEVRGAGGA